MLELENGLICDFVEGHISFQSLCASCGFSRAALLRTCFDPCVLDLAPLKDHFFVFKKDS